MLMSPDVDGGVVYVGLKGFSRYSDENAMTLEQINELSDEKEVYVALNRIKRPEEIIEVIRRLKCKGVILNDVGTIWKAGECGKEIVSSVGLNPLNILDIEFLKDIGVDIVVIPPELNEDFSEIEGSGFQESKLQEALNLQEKLKAVKIEIFTFALLEMFYKGKCLLSAYFDGISSKKEGVCTKKCCRKWNVFYDGKLKKVSFNPVARKFEGDLKIKPQYLKVEGRQFRKF